MASADTNVLVRLLTNDEPRQAGAVKRFIAAHGPLRVSQLALVEALWVLDGTYRLGRTDQAEVVEALLAGAEFVLEREGEVEDALQSFRASRADFADCLLLPNAAAAGELPLATFDRALGKLQGAQAL